MPEPRIRETLEKGYCGRLATIGSDGYPYCVPLLYVCMGDEIYVHNTAARGHLRTNVEHDDRVCFEVDEAGEVFPYGRFECDSTLAYRSVIAFGRIRIVDDEATKQRFCEALMVKYGKPEWQRPQNFFPRLCHITVYGITAERMTGKELELPEMAQRWPTADHTKTPNAKP